MNNKLDLRFSSIKDFFKANEKALVYKMKAPYDDEYSVSFKRLLKVKIEDENKNVLIEANKDFTITLKKDQMIYVTLYKAESPLCEIKVMALHHRGVLPYEPYNQVNTRKLRVNGNKDVDPLTPAFIESIKRNDGNGLYINCNNPEKLTKHDIGKALSRVNISNKKVFFTFEHNNFEEPFYYGYQVKNTGKEDLYVTVLNMGFQLDGKGCWLGEREWVDFYNLNFRYDGSHWNDAQKERFIAYFNFSNEYKAPKNQPITYRIPAGKYIYIMGGTTKDAYKHINVFKTADKKVCGGCSNAAVLFDVIGEAEGAFFVYTNPDQIKDNHTHQGYVVNREGGDFGSQYVGYDNCHGVVDTHITFTFNDLTKSQDLPVKYFNEYVDEMPKNATPFMELDVQKHEQNRTYWVTHINPNSSHEGIGTDMTKYYTISENRHPIVIDDKHLDGRANFSNIGNWMMDYMDYFTFVNQGDEDREITISMKGTGSICYFFRDKNGKVIKPSPKFTVTNRMIDHPEGNIEDDFEYKVIVKAHTIKQFIVEYNLLANSCGYIKHIVHLK